jgi:hypothetical protein
MTDQVQEPLVSDLGRRRLRLVPDRIGCGAFHQVILVFQVQILAFKYFFAHLRYTVFLLVLRLQTYLPTILPNGSPGLESSIYTCSTAMGVGWFDPSIAQAGNASLC